MAETKKGRRYKPWYAIIGLLIILSFFTPTILEHLRTYGAELAGRILLDLVKRESNNYYTISYEKANLGLLKRDLSIENFVISPDSAGMAASDGPIPINSFEIHIPRLDIKLETFYEIFLYKELKVESVKIIDPSVAMVRTNQPDARRPFSMEAGDLYTIISQYLKLFKIEYFQIQDAAFSYQNEPQKKDTSNLNIANLDMLVENFSIDSASNEARKVFFTDAIELVINEQILYLSDSIHQFSFDKLILSTQTQLIQFDGIKVSPRADLEMSFFDNPEGINIYDVEVPRLQLQAVDFLEAYFNNRLKIGRIGVFQPQVRIDDRVSPNTESGASNSLGAILTQYFDEVAIREVLVEEGLVDLKLTKNQKGRGLKLENADIKLENFRVDTSFFRGEMKTNFFEEIELSFDHYNFNLPDSLHAVYIKDFKLSSIQETLILDSVRVSPREGMNSAQKTVYNAYLPEVNLKGFDWTSITRDRLLVFDTFQLPSPNFSIVSHNQQKSESSQGFSAEATARKLLSTVEQLAIQYVDINNGRLHFKNNEEELLGFEYIDLKLDQFDLNKSNLKTGANSFYTGDIDLTFRDFDVEIADRTQMVWLDEFNYSTKSDRIFLNGIRIKPVNEQPASKRYLINGTVDEILLEGIVIDDMLDEKHFQFDHLLINRPAVDLVENENYAAGSVKQEGQTPDWLKYLSIQDFKLVEGRIRVAGLDSLLLNVGNANASVSNFSLDSLQVQKNHWQHNMQSLQLSLENVSWLLEKQDHQLEIDRIDIDQQQNLLDIQNVLYKPLPNRNPKQKITYQTPDIAFRGLDLEEIFFDRILEADSIIFQKGSLEIAQSQAVGSGSSPENRSIEALREKILDQFTFVDIQHLFVDSSSLSLGLPNVKVSIPGSMLQIDGFSVNAEADSTKIFFADNYKLMLRKLSLTDTVDSDSLFVSSLHWALRENDLRIDELFFRRVKEGKGEQPLTVHLAELGLKGFEVEKYYETQVVAAKQLQIASPHLSFYKDDSDENGSVDMPEKLNPPKGGLASVVLDSIDLDNIAIDIYDPSIEDTAAFRFRDLNILLTDFDWDSTKFIKDRGLFFADNIHVDGDRFSYLLPDSLYRINADHYAFDSRLGDLVISKMELEPMLEMYALGEQIGHQTDWIHGFIDTLHLDALDISQLLFDQSVDVNALYLKKFRFLIFRDKRLPFPEDQFKMLPHLALQELDVPLTIDTINIMDGFIEYQEFAEGASEPGEITFEALHGQVKNVVNTDKALSLNSTLELNASAKVMGQAQVYINTYADMLDEKGKFFMDGKVESFPLTVLNPMLEHVAFVRVRSGDTKKIEFELEADDEYAVGEMKFFYEDLKISLVSKKTESDKGMGPALGSFFANTFIVNSNNPNFLFVRNGDIYFERDKQKSIFNYWSKTFLSGVVSSIGAKSNKKDIKKKNKEALKRLKMERKEERMLEERVGVYD